MRRITHSLLLAIMLSAVPAYGQQWGCPSNATWCTNQGGGQHQCLNSSIVSSQPALEAFDNALDSPFYTGSTSPLPWNYGVIGEINLHINALPPTGPKKHRVYPVAIVDVNVAVLYGLGCDARYSTANCFTSNFPVTTTTGSDVDVNFNALAVNLPAGNLAASFAVVVTSTKSAQCSNVNYITEEHDILVQ